MTSLHSEDLSRIVRAFERIGDGMHRMAEALEKRNRLTEIEMETGPDNAEANFGQIAAALEVGLGALNETLAAYVGDIRIGLIDAAPEPQSAVADYLHREILDEYLNRNEERELRANEEIEDGDIPPEGTL